MSKRFLLLLLLLGLSHGAFAHGLFIQSGQEPPFVWIKAVYEGDIPLPFALVSITAPDGTEHQNGRCDRNGRFIFQPDENGSWGITVDDEMGHVQQLDIVVSEEPGPTENKPSPVKSSPWLKWLLGVSLILLLTSALYIWKKRI